MPDPHLLYVVSGVVVFGLVTWVVIVMITGTPSTDNPQPSKVEERPKERSTESAPPGDRARPWLQSYAEIQDEGEGKGKGPDAEKDDAET